MTVLFMSFAVFVSFMVITIWFGFVKRADLVVSASNRATLRMAGAMAVCSGLMSLLLAVGCPFVVVVLLLISFVIGATPLYRTIVRRMEGIH